MRLRYQFELVQTMRDFFKTRGFVETLTPPMVSNPGMETHIHPFQVKSVYKNESLPLYLHTSPEFQMKELLSMSEENLNKIYQINYVFRDEPTSPIHRNQFIMLEWYRTNADYKDIMEDTIDLLQFTQQQFRLKNFPIKEIDLSEVKKITVQELFLQVLDIDILNYLDTHELKKLIQDKFTDVPLPASECSWDDYYFLLFLNKVEPKLKNNKAVILYEFPAPLAALSKISPQDKRVCERFELYLDGVELCNAFSELTDLKEQRARFELQQQEMKKLYDYNLPEPEDFYQALKTGLPKSSGNALGVERLLAGLLDLSDPFYR